MRVPGAVARIREAPVGLAAAFPLFGAAYVMPAAPNLDQSVHVVGDVGHADLRLRSVEANGADHEGHQPFLIREDMFDRRPLL